MKMNVLGAVFAALLASAAAAQEMPQGKWWQRPEIVRELALSGEQRERLDTIFRGTAPGLIELRSEAQKKAVELRNQLDRPTLDRESIQRAATEVSEARARLFERELMMLVEMRGVLNQQQWNRFRSNIEKRTMRRPMGPGMGPGTGPGVGPGAGRGTMRPGGGGRRRP